MSTTGATSLIGTSGATFHITGVQLEAGFVATPFERRDYGTELARCERYYQVVFRDGWVRNYASNVYRNPFSFRTAMRGIPAVSSTISGTTTGLGANNTTASSASSGYIDMQFTAGGTGVIDVSGWLLVADAEL
jgi:hypothetical protein